MRLALQREMDIEQPRLLSEAERDDIAGRLAQVTPADRPAIIAGLRGRYGPDAGMLAAELTGEVDANTALLIAHVDMPICREYWPRGWRKQLRTAREVDGREFRWDRPPAVLLADGITVIAFDPGLVNSAAIFDRLVFLPRPLWPRFWF